MTHDELLAKIDSFSCCSGAHELALRAVVELHIGTGINNRCVSCSHGNPCETIQVIENKLCG
jgi:hypothetical protein